jgi:hypothetical protein
MAGIEQMLRDEEPEWLHLRNADGTISHKRVTAATPEEMLRFAIQMRDDGIAQSKRVVGA